jgi:hypothetical protein
MEAKSVDNRGDGGAQTISISEWDGAALVRGGTGIS